MATDILLFTQSEAAETLTQYEFYYDLATEEWIKSVAPILSGESYPIQPVNERAYRRIVVAVGELTTEDFEDVYLEDQLSLRFDSSLNSMYISVVL